jgi:hypothetical protein
VFDASGRSLWPERGVHCSKARQIAFENELERIKRLASFEAVTFEKGWLQSSNDTSGDCTDLRNR